MMNVAKKAFTKMANNWILKPIQSMMDKEFPSPQMIAAMNVLFGIKQPIPVRPERNHNRLQR